MKKYFLSLVAIAAAMLFATSCQESMIEPQIDGTTTFSVQLPDQMGTKAEIGSKLNVTQLFVSLYSFGCQDAPIITKVVTKDANAEQFTVSFDLVQGQKYSMIFWAQATDKYLVAGQSTLYDLRKISIAERYYSSEDGAAFYSYEPEVTSGGLKTVTLRRPFAQLNIGTTVESLKTDADADIILEGAKIKIENVASSFNTITGCGEGDGTTIYGQPSAFVMVAGEEIEVNGNKKYAKLEVGGKSYVYVTMDYLPILSTVDSPKDLVDVNLLIDTDQPTVIEHNFTNVPVQRNYRTNIIGDLITSTTNFDVIVDDSFVEDDKFGVIDGQVYERVSTSDEFNAAFTDENVDLIILEEDVVLTSTLTRGTTEDYTLTVSKDKSLTIDLNGKKLSATSTQTGSYNMFDVRGTLTVLNGTIEYKHQGENMGWNNFAEIFYVAFDGTLNLDKVTAKNLGGSDMAYVIDMVNATNITVNINNSNLVSTYIPIRVFNNNKTGVHNVSIHNSNLDGKYCFWVQYWLADGRDEATLDKTLKFDIFNSEEEVSNNNTFLYTNDKEAPVLYGFNEYVYIDEYGEEISQFVPVEINGVEVPGVAYDPESQETDGNNVIYKTVVVTAADGLPSLSAMIAADENNFKGRTVRLETDVDLEGITTNGDSFAPIGSTGERDGRGRLICKPFKGTFDGNGKTIKGIYQSGWDMGYEWGQYGSIGLFAELQDATVKDLTIEGMTAQVEGGDISFIAGSATGTCVFENITIKNSGIGTYNNGCGGIIGWSGEGNYTFKNITIGEDVVLGGLWGSFDSSIGGIVGQAEPGATYNFKDVTINCRIDAYNDCTASYDYYNYRMCGMIIGRCEETTTINGSNYPDLSKYNMTFNNVVVNYGTWMNYHYCEPTPGHNGGRGMRVESGYAYGGLPDDYDHAQCVDNHYNCIPFDQLVGGAQIGVKGLKEVEGVTVNYPAEYTCDLCGERHNKK